MKPFWHYIPAFLLLPSSISAITLDCSHIRVDEQSFNLKKLGGPKTVHRIRWEKPSIENTTFTVDICAPLKKPKGAEKDTECDPGTRVCAKEWDYPAGAKEGFVKRVISIAGEYSWSSGKGMDPKFTRLKNSAGNNEGKEGVTVELHGGRYPDHKSGTPQKAIIEFLCDRDVTGNEGFEDEKARGVDVSQYGRMKSREDGSDESNMLEAADDDDEPELPDPDEYKNLKFLSYKMEGDNEVLRLRWKTKFACEGAASNPPKGGDSDDDKPKKDSSAGWGFFTWFIIILFLLAASYIIFGSWLNYNRYGARGWDLIPHGDTIRDIPYIVKDFGGNLADKLKGGGERGGYSAV